VSVKKTLLVTVRPPVVTAPSPPSFIPPRLPVTMAPPIR
jgi:hypothetical protein